MLSTELFGDGFLLRDFPELSAIKGLGLSDQESYAGRLAKKFDYTNTFYDREPQLDITEKHPESWGTYDFLLSSDVFEHIAAPVERAFEEAYRLLKPHGVLCMSVPFSLREETAERFPSLHQYTVVDLSGTPILINRTREGALEIRDDLVFHGGEGATLELRLFSKKDLEAKLKAAGFREIQFQTEPAPEIGVIFPNPCSLPLVARKQEFVLDRRAAGQLAANYNAQTLELADALQKFKQLCVHVDRLDSELAERALWTEGLKAELEEARASLDRLQAEFQQRTDWAIQLNGEVAAQAQTSAWLQAQLRAVAESRWMKLGNKLGLGPKVETGG